ncbi:MAG: LamG domain-containing protein [Planctomycetota bacterium]
MTSVSRLLLVACLPTFAIHAAAQEFSWQDPKARVLPTGDLEWTPEPFVYEPGDRVRYIDFENGDDRNAGTDRDAPWKHHPWDEDATGRSLASRGTGIDTYVFKRGVAYRGKMRVLEQGRAGRPIRLTSDPDWGGADGEAVILGSEQVRGWEPLTGLISRLEADPVSVETAENHDTGLRSAPLGDWGTLELPDNATPGEPFEVRVTLPEAVEGQQLLAHLHWRRGDRSHGGVNASGRSVPDRLSAVNATAGVHTFRLNPQAKPDLGDFVATVFLSPDGAWANHTQVAQINLSLRDAEAEAAAAEERAARPAALDIPDPESVWYVELDYLPRNLWVVHDDDSVARVPLARTPNWEIETYDDIKKQWPQFDNPGNPHFKRIEVNGVEHFLGIDTQNINREPEYYDGAYIWNEYGWVMGTPYPSRIVKYFPEKNGFAIEGQWSKVAGARHLPRWSRYYLEDKPHYLDDPKGEFWFERFGGENRGRLYLRLADGQNPNDARVEVARHATLIDGTAADHVHFTGLAFRFTNTFWDLDAVPRIRKDVDPAVIRIVGSGVGVRVANCLFQHVNLPVKLEVEGEGSVIDDVSITDNVIFRTDHAGIEVLDGSDWGEAFPDGRLLGVEVLRNNMQYVGLRPTRWGQGHGLRVMNGEITEIAGNFLDKIYGGGIYIFGGKRSSARTDRPLSRILVHHNKVTRPLINTNDFAGIETWQSGPAYVFSNVSGNPGGYKMWAHRNNPKTPGRARFGFAYYMDGGFKQYYFNNIAWGQSNDPFSPLANGAAFQEIHGYLAYVFNNTAYNFVNGSRRQAPAAGRNKYMGNIWHSIGHQVFRHSDGRGGRADPNADDATARDSEFNHGTNAYHQNVFYDPPERIGLIEPSGNWYDSVEGLLAAMRRNGTIGNLGEVVDDSPLKAPDQHDFRPTASAEGRGVDVFVPWPLYSNVGEWHFYARGDDPSVIPDEHWNHSPYFVDRRDYQFQPNFPLRVIAPSPESAFERGALEDWTDGALRLDGNTYAELTKQVMEADANRFIKTMENDPADWVTLDAPRVVVPDQPTAVRFELIDPPEGMQLRADLHTMSFRNNPMGVNAPGGDAIPVEGSGPYTVEFAPKDHPWIEYYYVVAWLSPTGAWEDRVAEVSYDIAKGLEVPADGYRNPDIDTSSFIIETYARFDAGQAGGVLVAKHDGQQGYELCLDSGGRPVLRLLDGQAVTEVAADTPLTDGAWHHLVTEFDRPGQSVRFYLDGRLVHNDSVSVTGSLTNPAPLFVGGTPEGQHLRGSLDFLRIARGTLTDAKTTIEELHAWQFAGPAGRDFTGTKPVGPRDAGAVEGR